MTKLRVMVLCLSYFTDNSITFESFKSQLDETSAFAFSYGPYITRTRIAFQSERKASVNNPSKSRTQ